MQNLYLLLILVPILVLVFMPFGMYLILRSRSQTIKWQLSFVIASALALLGYLRIQNILGPPLPIPLFIIWNLKIIAVLSPTFLAVACLRWSGLQWRPALLLFPLVPVGMLAFWIISEFPFAS